jgi:hypothetical protein
VARSLARSIALKMWHRINELARDRSTGISGATPACSSWCKLVVLIPTIDRRRDREVVRTDTTIVIRSQGDVLNAECVGVDRWLAPGWMRALDGWCMAFATARLFASSSKLWLSCTMGRCTRYRSARGESDVDGGASRNGGNERCDHELSCAKASPNPTH